MRVAGASFLNSRMLWLGIRCQIGGPASTLMRLWSVGQIGAELADRGLRSSTGSIFAFVCSRLNAFGTASPHSYLAQPLLFSHPPHQNDHHHQRWSTALHASTRHAQLGLLN